MTPSAVPDPKAWAKANIGQVRYHGCRICDLGPELCEALSYLYDTGFRRAALTRYITEAGGDVSDFTESAWSRHFSGGPEHGRP